VDGLSHLRNVAPLSNYTTDWNSRMDLLNTYAVAYYCLGLVVSGWVCYDGAIRKQLIKPAVQSTTVPATSAKVVAFISLAVIAIGAAFFWPWVAFKELKRRWKSE
jgi:DMSO/TMAO reductase YedYZ heme-binding membrane subunit